MPSSLKTAFLTLIICIISGCQANVSMVEPGYADYSMLHGSFEKRSLFVGEEFSFESVDGNRARKRDLVYRKPSDVSVKVAKGHHEIVITGFLWRSGKMYEGIGRISVNLEAGKEYKIGYKIEESQFYVWLFDIKTNQVVGRISDPIVFEGVMHVDI